MSQHHIDMQPGRLSGKEQSVLHAGASRGPRMSVQAGPGRAQWHVGVWLVGLTVHCLTDSHRHAQTAFRLSLVSVRLQRPSERGREPKGAIYKKIRFRRLVSLAAHEALTLQVTEKENIANPFFGTSDSYTINKWHSTRKQRSKWLLF